MQMFLAGLAPGFAKEFTVNPADRRILVGHLNGTPVINLIDGSGPGPDNLIVHRQGLATPVGTAPGAGHNLDQVKLFLPLPDLLQQLGCI